jgi:hypothetical protein
MKNKLYFLFCLGIAQLMLAQKAESTPKGFLKSISTNDLKKHLYYIAGPETEGRGTGTPGLAKAALYIENHFKQLGLQPVNGTNYQQAYTLLQDSIVNTKIMIGEKAYDHGNHFGASNRSNQTVLAEYKELIFVGFGIHDPKYSDYEGLEAIVKDKIVVINEGEPKLNDSTYVISGKKNMSTWSWVIDKKVEAAAKFGAKAVFIIATDKSNRAWSTKLSGIYPEHTVKNVGINRYMIGKAIYKALFGEETPVKGQVIQKTLTIQFNKIQVKSTATNVAAMIPGTEKKDEYVILTAHMDHLGKDGNKIYYGADDDGSGTCAIMELAEAFAKVKERGYQPKRNVIFMTVSGEERGLWGSKYYTLNPLVPLEKTSVNLNIDMIGRSGFEYDNNPSEAENYVYVIGDDKLSTDLRPINETANKISSHLKLDYKYNDPNDPNRFYFRSDHYNFAEKGVPIIFYFDGEHKDYHQITDTPDKINYKLYARRARLVAATAWLMANKSEMLKRDIPLNISEEE